MPRARERSGLPYPLRLCLLVVWLLTTGSSCQATVSDGRTTVVATGAAAGVGIALYLAGGAVYCAVKFEECFPDKEALRADYEAYVQAQARFTTGLRRHQAHEPEGLALICRSAQDGYAIAQYFYGSHLLRHEPERRAEAISWLRRAAEQGHRTADLVLRSETGQSGPSSGGPDADSRASAVPPCAAA